MIYTEGKFLEIAEDIGAKCGVDSKLLLAIAKKESCLNHNAVRYEPEWSYPYKTLEFSKNLGISRETEKMMQSCSWGLMQVMGTVAREFGFTEPLHLLCEPHINLRYACFKIKSLMDKYDSFLDVVSAYNQGYPKKDRFGNYANEYYVNSVLDNYYDRK